MNNGLAIPQVQGVSHTWSTEDFTMLIIFIPAMNRFTALIIAKDEATYNRCQEMVNDFSSISQVTITNTPPAIRKN